MRTSTSGMLQICEWNVAAQYFVSATTRLINVSLVVLRHSQHLSKVRETYCHFRDNGTTSIPFINALVYSFKKDFVSNHNASIDDKCICIDYYWSMFDICQMLQYITLEICISWWKYDLKWEVLSMPPTTSDSNTGIGANIFAYEAHPFKQSKYRMSISVSLASFAASYLL